MLDADLCGALQVPTSMDGIRIDDDQLAVDAFAEVGPGNHFFGCDHTMPRHYETAFWDSDASSDNDRRSKSGRRRDQPMRPRGPMKLWKRRLAEFEAVPYDGCAVFDDGLADFVARKKAGMADAWY